MSVVRAGPALFGGLRAVLGHSGGPSSPSLRAFHPLSCLQEKFTPVKYFSIDRVFRNESLDATHLAEFHQVEGVVADRGLTLGHLMGILRQFFTKLGTRGGTGGAPRSSGSPPRPFLCPPDPQGSPSCASNPPTTPTPSPAWRCSATTRVRGGPGGEGFELGGALGVPKWVWGLSSSSSSSPPPGLKKWVEVGNSGVFRPELLLPMGLPENVSVIAWGLSLER